MLALEIGGFVSKYTSTVNDDGDLVVRISLTPATEEDRAERAKRVAERKARKAAPASETPAAGDGAAEAPSEPAQVDASVEA